jgi:lysophospholipase L1-like esterase
VKFNFQLDGHAYLIFEYNRSEQGFSGLRLSRSQNFESVFLKTTKSGEFEVKEQLEPVIIKNGWNTLVAKFSENSVSFFLNENAVFVDHAPILPNQKIGFRSSTDATLIDDITVIETSGEIFKENFRNTKDYLPTFGICFFILSLMAFLMPQRKLYLSESLICSLGLAGLIFYMVDFAWLSAMYPKEDSVNEALFPPEVVEQVNNIEHEPEILERIAKTYQAVHKNFRIMFIGRSQTWGAGVSENEDTISQQTENILNKLQLPVKFECINTGISGGRSAHLFELYKQTWVSLKPDLVAINMSNSEVNHAVFKKSLEKFVQLNNEKKIRTVFILEPSYVERDGDNPIINHEIMRSVAKLQKIPIIDLHAYMKKHSDDGLTWWDNVHMTSFGQRVAAQGIVQSLTNQKILSPHLLQ